MGIFRAFKRKFVRRASASNFIFYKLISFDERLKKYLLQCINSKGVFLCGLDEIVNDMDILYGLHPLQSCYLGMEYSSVTPVQDSQLDVVDHSRNKYDSWRYGKYHLLYQKRGGMICFSDVDTDEIFTMPLMDVVFSDDIISEFDSIHAFFIGWLAGLSLAKDKRELKLSNQKEVTRKLYLIK